MQVSILVAFYLRHWSTKSHYQEWYSKTSYHDLLFVETTPKIRQVFLLKTLKIRPGRASIERPPSYWGRPPVVLKQNVCCSYSKCGNQSLSFSKTWWEKHECRHCIIWSVNSKKWKLGNYAKLKSGVAWSFRFLWDTLHANVRFRVRLVCIVRLYLCSLLA